MRSRDERSMFVPASRAARGRLASRASRRAGYTLMELLATVALVGILATTALGLVTTLSHAVAVDELRVDAFESRLFTVRILRSEAARALTATVDGDRLTLVAVDDPGADPATVHWGVRGGRLVRLDPRDVRPCDAGTMDVVRRGNVLLVVADIPDVGRIVARVGVGR